MKRVIEWTVVVLVVISFSSAVSGGDWPQFRYDSQRSAASPHELPQDLHLQWTRQFAPAKPAYPQEVRLAYDAGYEPVVLGKTVFVPSMVTDSVTALNTDTGEVRWRYFADGPIRFAPVASADKVYFVSDDGHLYCVSAHDGVLQWKFRGLPATRTDRSILGNGRLISLRPARGGPVLASGVVYFGAGIWLGDGIFIHALDAETGKVIWSNTDSHLIEGANLDHGVKSYAGLSPQGYLTVLRNRLCVPCGAQLPAFLDRSTGKLERYSMGWGGRVGLPKGSWLVAGTDKYLIHSGDVFDMQRPNDERFKDPRGRPDFKGLLYPGGFTRIQIDPTNQRELGEFRQPVVTAAALYSSGPNQGIVATSLANPALEERTKSKPAPYRKNDQYPDKWKATFSELWRLDSKLSVHIMAGHRLYLGGADVVEAIDLPSAGGQPRVSWQARIQGTPSRMLAADDKLFVVTRDGQLHAFAARPKTNPVVHQRPNAAAASQSDEWTGRTRRILDDSGVSEGYALLLGCGSGRLAEELIRQSDVFVIAVDANAQKVARLRKKFHALGVYGQRISIRQGDPLMSAYPPYLASLIVAPDVAVLGKGFDAKVASRLLHPLRPYGGAAYLPLPATERAAAKATVAELSVPGLQVRTNNEYVVMARNGRLPGAADWSHAGANAANTGACEDAFLKAPLGMLWFDGSVRWHRKPGSVVIRVAEGRIFLLSDRLLAIDVFTGRHLWEAKPPLGKSPAQHDMVALGEQVYITAGSSCLELDAFSGRQTSQIDLPASLATDPLTEWQQVRVRDDFLVGSAGKSIFCIHRPSGKLLWSHECQHSQLSLAVGEQYVFCAEISQVNRKPTPGQARREPRTRAFKLRTGELLWQIPEASQLRYSNEYGLLITSQGVYQAQDGKLVRKGDSAVSIAGDKLIATDGSKLTIFDLLTAETSSDELAWYRRGCTDLRACSNLATTRFRGNAAYIDLQTRQITPLWNIRAGCNNNLLPANGVLSVPNLSGGCECNYSPTSLAFVPLSAITAPGGDP